MCAPIRTVIISKSSNHILKKLQKLPTSLQSLLDEDHRAVKNLRTDKTAEAKANVIETKKNYDELKTFQEPKHQSLCN